MTAGTLINIPKQYTLDEPWVIFDNYYDIYTIVSLVNEKGTRMLLGAIYVRPPLMQDNVSSVAKQFNDIEKLIDHILNERGWTPNECKVILGVDLNSNLEGDIYRGAASTKVIYKRANSSQGQSLRTWGADSYV